jgi:ferredoxin
MKRTETNPERRGFLPKEALTVMIESLKARGYTVIAPVLHKNVIKLKPITDIDEIARGLRDILDGGHYYLEEGDEDLFFEYVVGPDSAKCYFFPAWQELFALDIQSGQLSLHQSRMQVPKFALFGLRPCDLAAIRVQDKVFAGGKPAGAGQCEAGLHYRQRRSKSVVIAINCTRPGGTCFCDSMKTGPKAIEGFDVAMTELRSGFILEAGSETGMSLLNELPLGDPSPAELELADLKMERAREHMGRMLNTQDIVELMDREIENARWDNVAERCLSCGNCTMVCPTCFCSTVIDSSDLAGQQATRARHWESCFTHQFSYTTTGPHRHTIKGRYRHWLRHKLGTWWEQFGTSGCVGCGRCITWCPVGIDLTEETTAIRASAEKVSQ